MEHAMKKERTAEGKVVLYSATTGKVREFWPVDAAGHVASGDYVEYPAQPGGEVPALAPNETAAVQPLAPASAPLPTVTPLGAPAVHSTAADASPAAPLGEPTRRARRPRG
jgi:hypothetical protein